MSSMKDVALLAGVSQSTVSRVINGTMHVDEATKKRVEEAVAAANYRPNLLAQGLRAKSARSIGLLVPEIAHPSYNMVIKYIEESAFRRGLNLVLFNTHNDYKEEAVAVDLLLRQRINGIIFSRVSDESQIANIRETTDTPVVIIDRVLLDEKIPSVILNNYRAGVLAAEHLLKRGCRRLACITGNYKIGLCRDRYRGFKETIEKHGIACEDFLRFEGNFNYDTGVRAVEYFIEKGFEFDGVWGQNDSIATGVISTLLRKGLRVPEDVSVIGMDDVLFARMYYPSITTIAQPYQQMCEKALEFIDLLSNEKTVSNYQIVLEPSLVIRESAP